MWSRLYIYTHTRDSSLNWDSSTLETCWNLIGRSMIAPPPVLSPNSIFLASSSRCVSVHRSGRDEKIAQRRRTARFRNRLQNSLNVESFCYALILFCHLYCGAEFKSLFYWHFGVAVNFIGSEVAILLWALLTWEQLFPTATGRAAWYQLLWFNGAIIVISSWGGGEGWLLDSRKNVKPKDDRRFLKFRVFSELGNLLSSNPRATWLIFHVRHSLDMTITQFPNKFFNYAFPPMPWSSKKSLYVAVFESKLSCTCISFFPCARHDLPISPLS